MRTRILCGSALGLGIVLIGAAVYADEESGIALEKAPKAVQESVTKAIGTSKLDKLVREDEDGKTLYEAEFKIGNVDHSVKVAGDGTVVEEEGDIELKSLPAAVTEAVKGKYPAGTLKEAATVKAGDKEFYEVEVKAGDATHELRITAAGEVKEDETKGKDKD